MLELFASAQNNIIGLIILVVIFVNLRYNHKRIAIDQKLFMIMILTTSLILVLDFLIGFFSGRSLAFLRNIHLVLTTIYFLLIPIPFLAWSMYVHFYFNKSERKLKAIVPFLVVPLIISTFLTLLSVFNGAVFQISENNIYSRGPWFWLSFLMWGLYFVVAFITIHTKLENNDKRKFLLLSITLIFAISSSVQASPDSRSLAWLITTLVALMIFIMIQNNELKKDYLTGLYNRRELDRYLTETIKHLEGNEMLFMILADLNGFKSINDDYGHQEGDDALRQTACLLSSCFRSEDFIARFAGDEFVIIVKLDHQDQQEHLIQRIERVFDDFNQTKALPYDLELSIGYAIYDGDENLNADQFFRKVDQRMYEKKQCSRYIVDEQPPILLKRSKKLM